MQRQYSNGVRSRHPENVEHQMLKVLPQVLFEGVLFLLTSVEVVIIVFVRVVIPVLVDQVSQNDLVGDEHCWQVRVWILRCQFFRKYVVRTPAAIKREELLVKVPRPSLSFLVF